MLVSIFKSCVTLYSMTSTEHMSSQAEEADLYSQTSATAQLPHNDEHYSQNVLPDHKGSQNPIVVWSRYVMLINMMTKHLIEMMPAAQLLIPKNTVVIRIQMITHRHLSDYHMQIYI